MSVILTPTYIASECFLSEVLAWVAFYKFPLDLSFDNSTSFRFDHERQNYFAPIFPDSEAEITPLLNRVGLPVYPQYLDDINWDNSVEEKFDIDELNRKLEAYQKEVKNWEEKYEEYVDIPKDKILLALKEGRLQGFGQRVPKNMNLSDDETDELLFLYDTDFEEIPNAFWKGSEIDWVSSSAKSGFNHFLHVYIDVKLLMDVFPAPLPEKQELVSLIAEQYFVNQATEILPKFDGRGRPSYNWEEFLMEVFDRYNRGAIPQKQEAFILDMSEWCRQQWRCDVGRSTLLQKISPFYKRFVKKGRQMND